MTNQVREQSNDGGVKGYEMLKSLVTDRVLQLEITLCLITFCFLRSSAFHFLGGVFFLKANR